MQLDGRFATDHALVSQSGGNVMALTRGSWNRVQNLSADSRKEWLS